jgi:signal transduction histidine kinase
VADDDAALREDPHGASGAGALRSGIGRLLAVRPGERAERRLVAALVDAVPSASFAALCLPSGDDALDVVAAIGLDEGAPDPGPVPGGLPGLIQEAAAGTEPRVAPAPGPPFPAGIREGAAAPVDGGGVLLLGTRVAPFDADALLVLRVAADRVAMLLLCERLERAGAAATEAARRVEADAERRGRTVDTILGIVGHDLRNPLGAVHMSAALLQKRGNLEGWQGRTVERIRSSAGRMGRIIADLLSYTRTRLGAGIPIQRREADLGEVVRKVVDELLAGNPDRSVDVQVSGDLRGEWDPDRLEQVASNLVSNAIDHGDPGTPVRVAVEDRGGEVALTVTNSAPEPTPELLAHLFEPFSRPPDELSRKASGLGLGLYIAREIVRGHGGDIGAQAANGLTVVSVRLPRRVAAAEAATRGP